MSKRVAADVQGGPLIYPAANCGNVLPQELIMAAQGLIHGPLGQKCLIEVAEMQEVLDGWR